MAKPPLFEHQKRSIEFLRKNKRVFDMSDPGTGKTRVAIEAFTERRIRGGKCALVIAPKSLLKSAWAADFRKFSPYMKTSIAWAANRAEAFRADADVYITNIDAAVWLAKQKPSFFDKFDTLIMDEFGAFKHHTSQRSKAMAKIKRYFDYRLGMNGTPNPNSVTELWHQTHLLDDGKRLGPSFYAFRQTVCVPQQVGPRAEMVNWVDRDGAQEAVSKLIEDITIRHKFEDCIDIPPNHEYVVPFYMNPTHERKYMQMQLTEMVAISETAAITAINAAATTTKLLQIASGAVYDEHGDYHLIDTDRYDMVADIAAERQHSVVFFMWKHQKDYLIKAFEKLGLTYAVIDGSVSDSDKNQAVELFQKGLYRVLLAHPQSAAHGLTLTRGTATIWASPTYNLEHYQQGLKRIYRAGQTEKTETILIIAQGSIEERVFTALQNKKVRMTELLGLLEAA
jgi:SNF2 family DNA or RNA helicase